MMPVDIVEVMVLEARMRVSEDSPVANALLACANEIIALREICSRQHVTVESNPEMQKLCQILLSAGNTGSFSYDKDALGVHKISFSTEALIETLGGIFKVVILAQGHTNG